MIENKKKILIFALFVWILSFVWIIMYLINSWFLSKDLTNTYIVFPAWWAYRAPTWYLEYYLSQEWGGLNKYTANHMTNFPSYIEF